MLGYAWYLKNYNFNVLGSIVEQTYSEYGPYELENLKYFWNHSVYRYIEDKVTKFVSESDMDFKKNSVFEYKFIDRLFAEEKISTQICTKIF